MLLAIIYALLRVLITLIITYVSVILDVIFAPFWFLAGLVPGAEIGTGGWFKDILANLAVFPVTILMFALGILFFNILDKPGGSNLFVPPLVGGNSASSSTFGGLLLFGFIFMTPQVLNLTKAALKAPKINLGPVLQPLGAAGGALGGGVGTIGAYVAKTPKLGERGGLTAVARKTLKF